MSKVDLLYAFPGLAIEGYEKTSDETPKYNCIGWAANDDQNWWWPSRFTPPGKVSFWPRNAPEKLTLGAFERAFKSRGFFPVKDGSRQPEDGYEKVAIYALGTKPTHAARQLPDGKWTHKLGSDIDVTANLTAVEGERYGKVVRVLRRKIK